MNNADILSGFEVKKSYVKHDFNNVDSNNNRRVNNNSTVRNIRDSNFDLYNFKGSSNPNLNNSKKSNNFDLSNFKGNNTDLNDFRRDYNLGFNNANKITNNLDLVNVGANNNNSDLVNVVENNNNLNIVNVGANNNNPNLVNVRENNNPELYDIEIKGDNLAILDLGKPYDYINAFKRTNNSILDEFLKRFSVEHDSDYYANKYEEETIGIKNDWGLDDRVFIN
jgi:hypothetical protein